MGFWIGVIVGAIGILLVLPLFSKAIMRLAAKRQLNNILGSVKGIESQFSDTLKPEEKEEIKDERPEDSGSGQ